MEAKPETGILFVSHKAHDHIFPQLPFKSTSLPWSYVGAMGAEEGEKIPEGTDSLAMEGLRSASPSAPPVLCERMGFQHTVRL